MLDPIPFPPRRVWLWLWLTLALLACQTSNLATLTGTPANTPTPPSHTPPPTRAPTPNPTMTPTVVPTATPGLALAPYHSDELGLSFDYPLAWHLVQASSDYVWLSNVPTETARLNDPEALVLFIMPLNLPDITPEALLEASAETLGLNRFSPSLDLIETLQPPTAQPHPGGLAATATYLSRYQNRSVIAQLTALQQDGRAALVIQLTAPENDVWTAAATALIQSVRLSQPTRIPHVLGGLLPESDVDAILHAGEIHEHILAAAAGSDLIVAVVPQGRLELDLSILSPYGNRLISSPSAGSGAVNAVRFQPDTDGEYVVRIASRSLREGRYSLSANKVYRKSATSLLPGQQLDLIFDGVSSRAIIVATASAAFPGQLAAIDSNGVVLTGADVTVSADPISRLIPLRLGRTYDVRLTNQGDTAQEVNLALALTPLTQVDLGAGSEIISHLTFQGDTPLVIPLSAMAPTRFTVAVAPEGALVVTGELQNSDGVRLAAYNSAQAHLQSFNLAQAGDYRLILRGQGVETGRATLNRYLPALLAGALLTDDQVFGWLPMGESLTFLVQGQPGVGQKLTLLTAELDLTAEWLDTADAPLWQLLLTPGESILITPGEARTYHLRLRARDQSEGGFSLLLSAAGSAPTPPAATYPAPLPAR